VNSHYPDDRASDLLPPLPKPHARRIRRIDSDRINVMRDAELLYWARHFEVEQSALTHAVRTVGANVDKVREYLFSNRR
jgi:hypothetical protein